MLPHLALVTEFNFNLPICLLATGAQQMLLQMLHSHPSQSAAEQVGCAPQDEDKK